jgi:2-keto-3-deoxy-L-rhamnonate aldolase RhmA
VQGIVFPGVESAAEAREAASHCRFSPHGERSSASNLVHFAYRQVPAPEVRQQINETTLVIVMIESPAALDQVDEIAAVPGVDIVHIGCGDMSAELGVPGQQDHPRVVAAVERIVAACRKHGRIAGLGGLSGGDPARFQKMISLGPRFITAGNEWVLMMSAARARAEMLRKLTLS